MEQHHEYNQNHPEVLSGVVYTLVLRREHLTYRVPFAGYCVMAREVILQITGFETGYRLRHVTANTALVLTNSKPVEIITTLRQHRLTDSAISRS